MRMKSVVTGLRLRGVTSSSVQEDHNATVYDNSNTEEEDNVPLPNFVPDTESLEDSFDDYTVCVTCNQPGGSLLVCTQSDCPVTVHVTCIAFKPHFDLSGNFFCPYCSYKRALNKTRLLRQKAIRSKIALSNFLENNAQTLRNKDNQNHHVQPEPVQMDNENHSIQPEPVQKDNENHTVEPELVQKDNENHPVEPELSVQDCLNRDEPEVCVDDSEIGEQHNDNDKGKDKDKSKGRVSVSGGSVSESISGSGSSVNETKDPDFSAEEVRPNAKRKVAPVKKSLLPERKTAADGGDEEEVTSTRRKPVKQIKLVINPNLLPKRRRRLHWTSDEENAIKEGVSKYSNKFKNISWRKILEDGCSVFDNTRTPTDLRDKWKTMNSKKGAQNTKN